MGLLYATGHELLPREKLIDVPTPEPLGPQHNPFPFHDFVSIVEDELMSQNIQILEQEFMVTAQGQRLFGAMRVAMRGFNSDFWSLVLGLRGAHDFRFARGLTLGSHVTVCSNLCFHGDLGIWKTKQTTNIGSRLGVLVTRALEKLPIAAEGQANIFDKYREHELEDKTVAPILLDMYRNKALSAPQLARSIDQWDKPTHDYGRNVFTLFNGVTEALKPGGQHFSPELHMNRSNKVTEILDDVVGI